MYWINKTINSPCFVDHVILVHVRFENRLKLCNYKGNLKVECAILPLLNANVLIFFSSGLLCLGGSTIFGCLVFSTLGPRSKSQLSYCIALLITSISVFFILGEAKK